MMRYRVRSTHLVITLPAAPLGTRPSALGSQGARAVDGVTLGLESPYKNIKSESEAEWLGLVSMHAGER